MNQNPCLAIMLAASVSLGCSGGGSVQPMDIFTDSTVDATDTMTDTGTPDLPYDTAGTCTPGSCPPGMACVDGMCRTPCSGGSCPGTQTCCNGYCANTSTDPYHCGACDSPCFPEGNFCLSGSCSCNGATVCDPNWLCCSTGGCVNALWDRDNCGGCGVSCAEDQQCLGGTCGGNCAETGCPEVPHGTASCDGSTCVVDSCEEGWADADGIFENGCECAAVADDNGGAECTAAYDLGELSDAGSGSTITVEGFVSSSAPEDWYMFTAVDSADTECDEFHVDVRFTTNPDDAAQFDVYLADCATAWVCQNDIEFVVAMDFYDDTGAEPTGECPCAAADPPAGQNMCTDNSAVYYVVVHLAEGASMGCEPYQLTVSNNAI